jgi:hypothetical protein
MHNEERTRRPIGRILVDGGFLSAHDLNLALAEQTHTNELLGQVLVRMGILDATEINAVLSIQEHLGQPDDAVKLAAGVRQMLGSLLVQAGQITPDQLEQGIAEQKRTGEKLGEVFVRLGLLAERQLNNLLDFQRNQGGSSEYPSPLRLGEILVSMGQITREQLDDALVKQKVSRKKLGEVLVAEGYVVPHQVKRGLRFLQMLSTSALVAVVSFGPLAAYGSDAVQAQTSSATSDDYAATMDALASGPPVTNLFQRGIHVIHLGSGTYNISRTIVLPSNTILEGEGDETILQAEASFTGSQFITNADFASGNRNISIRNLKIEFTLPQLSGDLIGIVRFYKVEDMIISNITMGVNSQMYAIDLSGQVRNATVEGCTIRNGNQTSGGGIMIRNSDPLPAMSTSNIVVRSNQIESVSDEPIAAFGWEGLVENVLIEQNTVQAQGASFGITAYGHTDATQSGEIRGVEIIGNNIEGSRNGAIGVMGGAENVDIVNNQVEGTEEDGIFLDPGGDGLPAISNITVSQNSIRNVGRHGIFADGTAVLLEQNQIANCSAAGVYAAAGVVVSDNVISGANPGILVDGGQLSDIRGNSLSNVNRILLVNPDGTTVNLTSN